MSKLLYGYLIPPNTPCPFRPTCTMNLFCLHKGKAQNDTYSCAYARGFDIIEEYKEGRKHSKMIFGGML